MQKHGKLAMRRLRRHGIKTKRADRRRPARLVFMRIAFVFFRGAPLAHEDCRQ